MLRAIHRLLQWLPPRRATATQPPWSSPAGSVVLYARVGVPTDNRAAPVVPPEFLVAPPVAPPSDVVEAVEAVEAVESVDRRPRTNHRAQLLDAPLDQLRLLPPHRCRQLASVGIKTGRDLAVCDPLLVTRRLGTSQDAQRTLLRCRRGIRFAASVPGMSPRDALLLIRIHRRSPRQLGLESPAALRRDLERFALSSRGQRFLGGRPIPSDQQLRRWIDASGKSSRIALKSQRHRSSTPGPLASA